MVVVREVAMSGGAKPVRAPAAAAHPGPVIIVDAPVGIATGAESGLSTDAYALPPHGA
jgi:hypothetical protein